MTTIAVIGPIRAIENWMWDFRGKVLKNVTRRSITIGDTRFIAAVRPESIQGYELAAYVCVGHRDDWTDELRRTIDVAQTRIR